MIEISGSYSGWERSEAQALEPYQGRIKAAIADWRTLRLSMVDNRNRAAFMAAGLTVGQTDYDWER